jgi:hypothetical protein
MNVVTLTYILVGIFLTGSLFLFGLFVVDSFLKWSGARRRAGDLLRTVLTREQYCQLIKRGYVDIPSPRDPQCIYRVPRDPGLVKVIEKGRRKASLCLQPLEWVPDADIVVIHKLMIEADEETYLQRANSIAPLDGSSNWED